MLADVVVRHYEKITHTPAVPLLVEGSAELFRNFSRSERGTFINWDDNAFVAFYRGLPVGVLSWSLSEWDKSAVIKLGWVQPGLRRQGVYRKLWEALKSEARQRGLRRIEGATLIENSDMRAVAKAFGRVEAKVTLVYVLDSDPDDEEIPY
jgi:GNAT superfamily N-acetyltransferase